ncbi:stalk domain-containing protein [Paenibacillus sp. PAMC21692]|uniref:stalk domain-containing protein n=1 Tax=Paenibacillus sp. PAMC21692 TaxID=2762320 RepID=UPI001C9A7E17|nr:stalk domain-containing protein [Paenibacillus sp. PAMC21692]
MGLKSRLRRRRWHKVASLTLLTVLLLFAPVAQAAGVSINVDGKVVKENMNAVVKKGTMIAPVQDIAELLGATYSWNERTSTLTVKKGDTVVTFLENSLKASVAVNDNRIEVALGQPMQNVAGEQLVPIRFLAELFGASVNWNQGLQQVQLLLGAVKGDKGEKGEKGDKGDAGAAGATGPSGSTGPAGMAGPVGPAGPQGEQGLPGLIGPEGPQGLQGLQGDPGPAGEAGADGAVGPAGPQGEQGLPGLVGPQGTQGLVGPQGNPGPAGEAGADGAVGPAGPQGEQGLPGLVGPQGPQGLAGPQGDPGPAGPAGANYTAEGFSASLVPTTVTNTQTLSGWNVASPFYANLGFDPATGQFVVPATGRYAIKATVNYKTTAAVTISLGAGIDPYFAVQRVSPMESTLVSGVIPILNVNVALVLSLRAPLGSATVTLDGEVYLNAGDVLELKYFDDGMTFPLDIGNNTPTTWSIHQLSGN